jgi:AraC family transcriptional regulator of adaptative response/methylated-DNA-[protein]-cysteine methyltransferase
MAKNPEARIRDADLRARGLEPATVRRHFLKNYGMTFQSYSRGMRMSKALEQIRLGKNLDEVTLGHGYESFSGFREAFANVFGQSPGRSREEDCVVVTWFESPLGPLVAGANSKAICLLEFTDPRRLEGQFSILQKRFECAIMPGENEHLLRLKSELEQYFSRKRTSFSLPLLYPGTPFQTKVWTELLKIPYGETISYEELSLRIGSPGAQRAVGHANGQNRISILIPCHRVVNKNGALGGYGGGLWRKKWLLQLEQNRNRILIP